VTTIKQIVRVGTTCSTVDKRAGEANGRETGWSAGLQRGKGGCCSVLRGKVGGRSTTPRTTRTCVCKMITRVHALARGRARANACVYFALICVVQREFDQGRTRHPDLWIERCVHVSAEIERTGFQR